MILEFCRYLRVPMGPDLLPSTWIFYLLHPLLSPHLILMPTLVVNYPQYLINNLLLSINPTFAPNLSKSMFQAELFPLNADQSSSNVPGHLRYLDPHLINIQHIQHIRLSSNASNLNDIEHVYHYPYPEQDLGIRESWAAAWGSMPLAHSIRLGLWQGKFI
jgi:hypothetical protein